MIYTESMRDAPDFIRAQVPLTPYTTFHIGGPAEYFATVDSVSGLREAVVWAHGQQLPVTVLGGGSNVLIADEGIRGLVVKNEIGGVTFREGGAAVEVTAGAGVLWDQLVEETVLRGLWGFENLSCIPGSVGATPIQNVGAYGVEVAEHIVSVEAYNIARDAVVHLTPSECRFGYRDSLFKQPEGKNLIVVAVRYALSTDPAPRLHYRDLAEWNRTREAPLTLAEIRAAVCAIRARKFPDWLVVGTAGSFFKNPIISKEHFEELQERYPDLPGHVVREEEGQSQQTGRVKVSLGWILDRVLALRGYREGNVGTYEGQALVLVNYGGATAREVSAFADALAEKVRTATGIEVVREVSSCS